MRNKPVAALVSAGLAVSTLVLAPAAAHAHDDDPAGRDVEVVAVIDTARAEHAVVKVRYVDALRGRTVQVGAESMLLAGLRRAAGPWLTPTEQVRWFRPVGAVAYRTRLPVEGNTARIVVPFDVARRPPAGFAPRRADAVRVTEVAVVHRQRYERAGQARIMVARAGDPANYFWPEDRISRVWDRDPLAEHAHRITVR